MRDTAALVLALLFPPPLAAFDPKTLAMRCSSVARLSTSFAETGM